MSLMPGTKLGPYEILALIGAGGMGEVYRARDPRLNRDVAIKVSQERFSDRFEREARAVAALNHPNICTLYDVGPDYLVMEFIEGESPKGPLPLEEALRIARQIADALEAAHEKGIVHRDLKPGNIKIKADGAVKVLDFGLAKTVETASGDPQSSPTMTISATRAGMILGTAAYMSPEQARGRTVDKRADIWAFGVVLYELLTGRMLFQGEDLTETVASVVKDHPDLSGVPERVRPLLEKCLEKDPRKRLRDIGDMPLLLTAVPVPQAAGTAGPRGHRWIPWAVAGALVVALAAVSAVHFRETPTRPAAVRFHVPAPEGGVIGLAMMALSPDGRQLAFLASGKGGSPQLWVRALDSLEARPLPGTEGGIFPFWSPDSRFLAFTSGDRKLKKIEVSSGPAQTLCSMFDTASTRPYAGDWTRDGAIFFGGPDGMYRVPQAGGEPVRVTQADAAHGELYHAYPQILADGRHFLYLNVFAAPENNGIYLGSFDGKAKKRLVATTRGFRYAAPSEDGKPGHLLFLREETLMAQPFNPKTLEVAGDAFPIAERVSSLGATSAGFTVSGDRALAYYSGDFGGGGRQLTWYDRTGKPLAPLGELAAYYNVALSRDGARATVVQRGQNGRSFNLWLIDVARGIPARFTFEDNAADVDPVWSPDGSRLAFGSNREGVFTLYVKGTVNAAKEERLQKAETSERPCDWSSDGRTLMYTRGSPGGGGIGLWSLSDMTGDPANRKASAYLDTKFNTTQCQFSPDGHWVAYSSDEAAQGMEVYVQSFPAGSGTVRVSSGGGSQPRWRRNGKELFYMGPGGKLMAVDVKTAPAFQAGTPHALFDSHIWLPEAGSRVTSTFIFHYDVSSDGQRFLVNTTQQTETPAASPGITVVLNWTAGLKK